jgi:hypothetical protein
MAQQIMKKAYIKLILLITFTLLFEFANSIFAEQNRNISFPEDNSLGEIYIRDNNAPLDSFWQTFGQAQGYVTIPANKAVWLRITEDSWQGKKSFEGLNSNDIQKLSFNKCPDIDDSVLEDIITLSGLSELDISRKRFKTY